MIGEKYGQMVSADRISIREVATDDAIKVRIVAQEFRRPLSSQESDVSFVKSPPDSRDSRGTKQDIADTESVDQ